jgi:hypothetical protein
LLLWSLFFLISGVEMITQGFDLWTDQYLAWYILHALALLSVLTFTLKRGWQIIRDQHIGVRQVLFFQYK